jgi:hypothetical protein
MQRINERSFFESELLPRFLDLLFKTFINHVRGLDKSVRRAGSVPRAIVWRAPIYRNGAELI